MLSEGYKPQEETRNYAHAYLVLRVTTGIIFAILGAVHFGNANYMAHEMSGSLGPLWETILFLLDFCLPVVAILGGFTLVLGFATRASITVLGVLIALFIFSTVAIGAWEIFGIQLLLFGILYWLHRNLHEDQLSFDRFLKQ